MGKTHLRDLRGPAAQIPNDPSVAHARSIRRAFQDEEPRESYRIGHTWPARLYEVGQGRAFGYTSNKWQERANEFEDYKHVAEGPQRTFITDYVVRTDPFWRSPEEGPRWPRFHVSDGWRFPAVVAELAPCLFLQVRQFERVTWDDRHKALRGWFGNGAAQIETPQSVLYAGKMLDRKDRPGATFCAIVSKAHGVLAIVFGPELGVTQDGIVG